MSRFWTQLEQRTRRCAVHARRAGDARRRRALRLSTARAQRRQLHRRVATCGRTRQQAYDVLGAPSGRRATSEQLHRCSPGSARRPVCRRRRRAEHPAAAAARRRARGGGRRRRWGDATSTPPGSCSRLDAARRRLRSGRRRPPPCMPRGMPAASGHRGRQSRIGVRAHLALREHVRAGVPARRRAAVEARSPRPRAARAQPRGGRGGGGRGRAPIGGRGAAAVAAAAAAAAREVYMRRRLVPRHRRA